MKNLNLNQNKAALILGGILTAGIAMSFASCAPSPAYADEPGHTPLPACHSGSGAHWTYIEPDSQGYNGHQHHHAEDIFGLTEEECLAKNPAESPVFQPYAASARWLLPADWNYSTTPSYQPAIFPQDVLLTGVPCGRWSQDDEYWLESPEEEALFASLDDDGVLTQGEDSAIYASHVFTQGPVCAEEPLLREFEDNQRTDTCESFTVHTRVGFYGHTFDPVANLWIEDADPTITAEASSISPKESSDCLLSALPVTGYQPWHAWLVPAGCVAIILGFFLWVWNRGRK